MLKKLLVLFVALAATLSSAFAAVVNVNSADQATLQTLRGIGHARSKAIFDERTKNGPFKDAADLARRVNGLGTKSIAKLEGEGLTIGSPSATAGDAGGQREKSSSRPAEAAAPLAAQTPSPSMATSTSKKNKKKFKHRKNAASAASAGSRA